jgi:hypothetical protein
LTENALLQLNNQTGYLLDREVRKMRAKFSIASSRPCRVQGWDS